MGQPRRGFLKKMTALAGAVAAAGATAIAGPSLTFAQTAAAPTGGPLPLPGRTIEVKSLKERLSDKASDEQRVDNCRVPLERRGSTPRPGCPGEADARVPATEEGNTEASRTH